MGWPLDVKSQAELDDKKRKPSKEIRVEDMKHALEFAQRTSARGGCKVILVFPAEHMNHFTANAMLKTLEEPPGDLRFVLATQDVQHLLPTLRSRCMSYAIAWPRSDLATSWLNEQVQGHQPIADESLQTLLQACSGRPAQALLMHQAGVTAARWNALPKELSRGQGDFFEGWSLLQVIDTLQKLCHDQLLASVGAIPRFFAASSLSPPPAFKVLLDWSKELMHARATAEHPFQAGLFLEHHMSRARVVLNSRS
jgi:DNA polymerase-3 subunit delta'